VGGGRLSLNILIMKNYWRIILFFVGSAIFFIGMFFEQKPFTIASIFNYDNKFKLLLFVAISFLIGYLRIKGGLLLKKESEIILTPGGPT